MKTLKKTLCLVLAVVMVVGVLIIPANAATTTATEDLEDKYEEALAVLNGLGILTGDEDGYRANDTITRQEAAAVVARLKETDAAVKDYPTSNLTYADCKSDKVWGKSYIAYVSDKNIANGDEEGFRPDDPVTGYEFAKMVLCALGYDAAIEQFKDVGDAWAGNVYSVARKIGLTEDVTIGNAAIKRGEVAQMAFNALFLDTVTYSGGTEITLPGGVTMKIDANRDPGLSLQKDLYKGLKHNGSGEGFDAELTKDNKTDEFGRPNVAEWVYGTETLYTEKQDAVLTGVYGDTIKTGEIVKAIQTATKDESAAVDTNGYIIDNKPEAADTNITLGAVLEVYKATDEHKYKVVAINTYADIVKEITTGDSAEIKLTTATDLNTIKPADFAVSAENVVIYTKSYDGSTKYDVVKMTVAEKVTGTQVSVTKDGVYTIGNKDYKLAAAKACVGGQDITTKVGAGLGIEYDYYLDNNGNIVHAAALPGAPGPETTTVYATVTDASVTTTTSSAWASGDKTVGSVQLKVLTIAGQEATYPLEVKLATTTDKPKEGSINPNEWYYMIAENTGKKLDVDGDDKTNSGALLTALQGTATKPDFQALTIADGKITMITKLKDFSNTAVDGTTVKSAMANDVLKTDGGKISATSLEIDIGTGSDKALVNNATVFFLKDKIVVGAANLGKTEITKTANTDDVMVVVEVTKDGSADKVTTAKFVYAVKVEFKPNTGTDTTEYVYLTGDYTMSGTATNPVYTYETVKADGTLGTIVGADGAQEEGVYAVKSDGKLGSKVDTDGDVIALKGSSGKAVVKAISGDLIQIQYNGSTTAWFTFSTDNVVGVDGNEMKVGAEVLGVAAKADDTHGNMVTILFVFAVPAA